MSAFATSDGFTAGRIEEYYASYQPAGSIAPHGKWRATAVTEFLFQVQISMKIIGVNGQSPLHMLPVIRQAGKITIHPTNHTCSALLTEAKRTEPRPRTPATSPPTLTPSRREAITFSATSPNVICIVILCKRGAFASNVGARTCNNSIRNVCCDALCKTTDGQWKDAKK